MINSLNQIKYSPFTYLFFACYSTKYKGVPLFNSTTQPKTTITIQNLKKPKFKPLPNQPFENSPTKLLFPPIF